MEILVFALLGGGLFVYKILRQAARWDHDPVQKELAQLFALTVRDEVSPGTLTEFIAQQGWPDKEVRRRIPHALTLTKFITSPGEYEFAKIIGKRISTGRGMIQ